ncbi:DUF4177 domain-containing protein [Sedimentitalea todarodis]|uniref:DUF4177 domain-containing protein n=1 Tax=Sedimentitalea todarodis TaxID=1631240 RepID=A0ABU3V8V2_9RHOB|nr:DUF4177 domain-containing protein [Sedimentitalea todarodis]MDU9002603.1 DUF4177 domain-containing protein [Sedimentitalea todarodis]
MSRYEYKVVPAPQKGQKTKGIKTPEGRFALSVEAVLNEMAASGWEYLRAELLPSEERSGLTGSTTNWRNVLIFRRALEDDSAVVSPVMTTPAAKAPPVVPAPSVTVEEPVRTPPLVSGVEPMPEQQDIERERN